MSFQEEVIEILAEHRFATHQTHFGDKCVCGWTSQDIPHAEHLWQHLVVGLGLHEEWSNDLAGPEWQRYCRLVSKTVNHPGPKRIAAGQGVGVGCVAGSEGVVSWLKITCEERDAIFHAERPEKLAPIASCTDMSGEFHGEPQMDITWGIASTDTPVLRESRYPSRDGGPDRKPCEHWQFQDDGW